MLLFLNFMLIYSWLGINSRCYIIIMTLEEENITKKSGILKEFPEIDKIKLFTLKETKRYINPSPTFFLKRLVEKLKIEK